MTYTLYLYNFLVTFTDHDIEAIVKVPISLTYDHFYRLLDNLKSLAL